MAEFLILKLQGVMQAWGKHTFEDYRPSELFPTRSGLVGLLAACLGLNWEEYQEQQKLSESFRYAVRVDKRKGPVEKITDYHTILNARKVDGSINTNAVVSRREYLCDAEFTVALEFFKGANYGLDKIKEAVQRPYYTPFLGRRSCPLTRPLYEDTARAENLHAALDLISPRKGTIYSELEDGSPNRLTVRDVPAFNGRRQFATRTIYIHAGR
ncbi:MAG: type I-E CRISPR-associated protein Cas5/CasD [Nitrospinales bacterium]